MSHLPPSKTPSRLFGLGVFVSIGLAFALPGYGQMSPEEHAKHHPGADKEKKEGGTAGMAGGEKKEGGMGGGMDMGKMMENMGKAPPKELYPTLMSVPELTLEQREQVRAQSQERMLSGVGLLSKGLDRLGTAAEKEDYAAMQEATADVREALARFESGLAAKRALAEGKPPRQVALQWFKGEMNLEPPQGVETRSGLFGVSLFHLFTMVVLIAFALAMVAMYFFKMRRAAALFGRIESDSGKPPPGSAKPLAGPPGADAKAKSPAADAKTAPAADAKAAPAAGAKAAAPPADEKAKPPAADAKPAAPAADAKAAAPGADEKAKPPAADAKAAPPAADAKPAAPADAKAAAPGADEKAKPPAADAKAASLAATKFACRAPDARTVFLAGTFNGWDAKATPMVKDAEGNWETAVALSPGHYEFKFVVDGALCCEPGCEGTNQSCPKCVPNTSGTMNRLIEVK